VNPIRVGKVTEDDREVMVVELFGVPIASSSDMVDHFNNEPDFAQFWTEYFADRFARLLVQKLHEDRGAAGWALAIRTAPRPPKLPEREESQ
jgi:hypothetical protein